MEFSGYKPTRVTRNAGVYGTDWSDECQHDLHPDFRRRKGTAPFFFPLQCYRRKNAFFTNKLMTSLN